MGSIYTKLKQLDTALIYLKEYSRMKQELYESNQLDMNLKSELANSYGKIAEAYNGLGDFQNSFFYNQKYTQLVEALYNSFPQKIEYRKELSIAWFKLSDDQTALGFPDKALPFFEKSYQLIKELYESFPKNIEFKNNLAICQAKLAEHYRDKLIDKVKARVYFQKAEALWSELVRDAPQYTVYKKFLEYVRKDIKNLD
jgi:tetratricopeptide (TPR) repeat protein